MSIPVAIEDARLGAEFTRDLNYFELENPKEYCLYFEGFPIQNNLKVDLKSDASSRIFNGDRYISTHDHFIKGERIYVFFREDLEESVKNSVILALSIQEKQRATVQSRAAIEYLGINQILVEYTSGWNKFFAWVKAIFSLGLFGLGLKKQQIAEDLKKALINPNDVGETIQKYQAENRSAVRQEFWRSCLFAKHYVADKDGKIAYNEGNFGNILDNALEKLRS